MNTAIGEKLEWPVRAFFKEMKTASRDENASKQKA
jgi:hypothetical protein